MTIEPIAEDKMGLFVSGDHPLAGRPVRIAEVVNHPFILPPQCSITRRILEEFFLSQTGRLPQGRVETSSQAVIRDMLLGTDFDTFRSLREFRFSRELADVVQLDLDTELPRRQICVLQRQAMQPSGAIAAFLQTVREVAAESD